MSEKLEKGTHLILKNNLILKKELAKQIYTNYSSVLLFRSAFVDYEALFKKACKDLENWKEKEWEITNVSETNQTIGKIYTITPINWYTALIENDPSVINLQSIAEQLLKEDSCDVNEVYLTMIQNKQHYFEEKTPRNLNIACRCMIHKSFSSYLYLLLHFLHIFRFSKFSNVMDYELWKIQFSHSLASFSFLQLLFK